jgi:hypothetical protein
MESHRFLLLSDHRIAIIAKVGAHYRNEFFLGFINERVAKSVGDALIWADWVKKRKRNKIQDRLLVVTRFRVLSIKRGIGGGKSVRVFVPDACPLSFSLSLSLCVSRLMRASGPA